jgi:hypothetical protein
MGLVAIACIGVTAFAWPSPHGQAAKRHRSPFQNHRCRWRKRNYPHSRPHLTLTSRLRQMQDDLRNHHLRCQSAFKFERRMTMGYPLSFRAHHHSETQSTTFLRGAIDSTNATGRNRLER